MKPETKQFVIGQRVTLIADADRFPFGIIPAGETGEVIEIQECAGIVDLIVVKLDRHFDWLAEWDNCLQTGQVLGIRAEDEIE